MNVTEKQKQILINFMRSHPDFGRGRLRYNRENKKKIDELWEEITATLNSAGCGPQKLPKEWAKTWRDWKSNLLKRVATYKSYASSTGGGPPKILDTSPSEDDLLEFLTPEASGMSEIPEGGAIGDKSIFTLIAKKTLISQNRQNPPIKQITKDILTSESKKILQTKKTLCSRRLQDDLTSSLQINAKKNLFNSDVNINNADAENLPINNSQDFDSWQTTKEFLTSQNLQTKKTLCSQRPQNVASSSQIDIEDNFFYSDVNVDDDKENCSMNISDNTSVENFVEEISEQVQCNPKTISTKRYSDDKDTSNKKRKNVKHILEQHTMDYTNTQERMLRLKEEELAIAKQKLQFLKDSLKNSQEYKEHLKTLIEKVEDLTNTIQSFAPQYIN